MVMIVCFRGEKIRSVRVWPKVGLALDHSAQQVCHSPEEAQRTPAGATTAQQTHKVRSDVDSDEIAPRV